MRRGAHADRGNVPNRGNQPGRVREDDAARRRYDKGALKTRFAVRQAVVKLAKAGNPQALKTYEEMAAEVKAERDGTAGSAADDEFANL